MNPRLFMLRNALCFLLPALMTGNLSRAASAQSILHPQTREKLGAHVRLDPGATTLSRILASLSAQTGLDIRAAPYLGAHGLTLQIEDASGSDVLNALAELNGWRWYEKEDKSIVVARPRVTTPAQLTGIPAMMRAATPPDIWRYQNSDQSFAPNTQALQQRGDGTVYGSQLDKHMFQQGDEAARLLPDIRNGKPVPYSKLTPEQQRPLLFLVLLMDTMNSSNIMGVNLMQGKFASYELDTTKCQMYMREGEYLFIGNVSVEGYTRHGSGFGASINAGPRRKPGRD